MTAPLDIPGYYYDAEKNRYFKGVRPAAAPPRKKQKMSMPSRIARYAARLDALDPLMLARSRLDHEAQFLASAIPQTTTYPPLTIGENITCFSFAEGAASDPGQILIGGQCGSVCRAFLNDLTYFQETGHPTTDPIRAFQTWQQGSTICLQATDMHFRFDRKHQGVTETYKEELSYWCHSYHSEVLAIGTDEEVRLTKPFSPMTKRRYLTKSDVFALCPRQDGSRISFLGGTRSGKLITVDARLPNPQVDCQVSGSIYNLTIGQSERLVILAGSQDRLEMRDIRFLNRPVLTYHGHTNQFRQQLGLAVFKESILAAANEDGTICIWSLQTGSQTSSPSQHTLVNTVFPEAIRSMAFEPGTETPILHVASGPSLLQYKG